MRYAPRFKLWAFGLCFTVIQLIAIAQLDTVNVDVYDGDDEDIHDTKIKKGWGIALTIISLIGISSILACYSHPTYHTTIINNNVKVEGITTAGVLILSTVLVAIVSSPNNGLAVDADGAVDIGNLYYFSWAAFINAILVLANYVETTFGINFRQTMRSNSSSFTYWAALLLTSLIVMGTSSEIYGRNCASVADVNKQEPYCGRGVLAITVGTVGVIFSLIIVAMKITLGAAPFLFEVGMGGMMFLFYVIEIIYVTDIQGPGSPLGNLYYFSWISFMLTFMVGKACYEDFVEAQDIIEQQQNAGERTVPTLANVPTDSDAGFGMEDDIEIESQSHGSSSGNASQGATTVHHKNTSSRTLDKGQSQEEEDGVVVYKKDAAAAHDGVDEDDIL